MATSLLFHPERASATEGSIIVLSQKKLDEISTHRKIRIVQNESDRKVKKKMEVKKMGGVAI